MRVAFVIQRYGREVNGGSEACCRMLAERLARRSEIEEVTVFTTCAVDHITWANHYPPGVEVAAGVRIERFHVMAKRSKLGHALLDRLVLGGPRLAALEPCWFRAQGPLVPALTRRLRTERNRYDAFVFFTYLYYPTVFGLPAVKDRAVLVPTAHDEPPIYMHTFRRLFRLPRAFGFLTPEERDFVVAQFGVGDIPAAIIGCGVDLPSLPEFPVDSVPAEPFVLYLGRIEAEKGFPELLHLFREFKDRYRDAVFVDSGGRSYRGADLKLVLVGRSTIPLLQAPDIIETGFVTDQHKVALLGRCQALILPSRFESLSLVLLEAWTLGIPVLANRDCAVTAGQIARSGGGLAYRGQEEFQAALARLLADPDFRQHLGSAGRQYVERNYGWDGVETRLLELVSGVADAAAIPLER